MGLKIGHEPALRYAPLVASRPNQSQLNTGFGKVDSADPSRASRAGTRGAYSTVKTLKYCTPSSCAPLYTRRHCTRGWGAKRDVERH